MSKVIKIICTLENRILIYYLLYTKNNIHFTVILLVKINNVIKN